MPSRLKGIETKSISVTNNLSVRYTLDMPSRLKGIETRSCVLLCSSLMPPTLDMPSRLKGIETVIMACVTGPHATLDMPSRLKGIETPADFEPVNPIVIPVFGYAFPFEGN